MFPLKDSIPSRTFPVVNVQLILINSLVFIYTLSLTPESIEWLYNKFGLIPSRLFGYLYQATPDYAGVAIPVVTSTFLHGGWLHFVGNMWYLWIFGDNIEDSMGHGRYLIFYLLCGTAAGLIHVYLNAGSTIPTVGASGAIAGIMGAYMLLYPRGKVLTFVGFFLIEIPAFIFLFIWILLQTSRGFAALSSAAAVDGVAWWAHIGGFAAGALLIYVFRRRPR